MNLIGIQSFLSCESLDKLVTNFIQKKEEGIKKNIESQKQMKIINSVLINLSNDKSGLGQLFKQIRYCLQINESDRQCLKKGAILLTEVIKRSRYLLQKTNKQTKIDIVKFSVQKSFITVSGNQFIALLSLLTSYLSFEQYPQIYKQVAFFLISPKLQINSYRQQTRLALYKLLNYILKAKILIKDNKSQFIVFSKQNQQKFIERCIDCVGSEKDPRNIGLVFQICLYIMQIYKQQQLGQNLIKMFQGLQSYYPIQFVGDQDINQHKKVSPQQIKILLNQCLIHSYHKDRCFDLISLKTAAPPMSPYVPLILAFISARKNQKWIWMKRFQILLLRLSEQTYIQENYPDDSPDLGDVFVNLLQFIFCQTNGYVLSQQKIIMKWLSKMIKRLTAGEYKQSGTMVGIFRKITNRFNNPAFDHLIAIFRSYSLQAVLTTIDKDNEPVPKLGLTIVALSNINQSSFQLKQTINLLILKIGQLYESYSDELKILLLKILLQIFRGCQSCRTMVRQVNKSYVLKDCLQRAKLAFQNSIQSNQIFLMKAFIDFISQVYLIEIDDILQQLNGINIELQSYTLIRLYESNQKYNNHNKENKMNKIISKFNKLIQKINTEKDRDDLQKGLKYCEINLLIKIMCNLQWKKCNNIFLIFNLLYRIRQFIHSKLITIQDIYGQTQETIIYSFLTTNQILYNQILNYLQPNTKINIPALSPQYCQNLNQFQWNQNIKQIYPPGLVSLLWNKIDIFQNNKKQILINNILQYLPNPIILKDSSKILNIVLKQDKFVGCFLKIVKNMDCNQIKQTGTLQYCLKFIQNINAETYSQKCASILTILDQIATKDKSGNILSQIKLRQKFIKRLVTHRKRSVRSSARKLLMQLVK